MPRDTNKILSLMFAIGRRMRERSPQYSLLHFQTLRYVEQEGRPLMHDVARYLCVTPPAATLLIDGLVKEKLLARSVDRKDRRAVRVALTPRGKRFIARGVQAKITQFKKVFSMLTAGERKALVSILEKVFKKGY